MNTGKLALMALVLLTTLNVNARAPHEKVASDNFQEVFDYNQNGKISAVMLQEVDADIYETERFFVTESDKADGGDDLVEGKIIASMINLIDHELMTVKSLRAELDNNSNIADSDIRPIKEKLIGINRLIEEINVN